MKKILMIGVLLLAITLGFRMAGVTNFDRLVLGSSNYGTDPNTTADLTFQNDEYWTNAEDGVLDAGAAQLTADGGSTLGILNYGGTTTSALGTDTYVATLSPALAAYQAGMFVIVKVDTANTGACTLNLNSLGAKDIKTASGADPANSDLVTTSMAVVVYNGTSFILINPATTTD